MRFPSTMRSETREKEKDGKRESQADAKMASNRAQHLAAARKLVDLVSGCGCGCRVTPTISDSKAPRASRWSPMAVHRGVRGSYVKLLPSGARRGVIVREMATSRDERAPSPPGTNAGSVLHA